MASILTQPPEGPSTKPRNVYGRQKRAKELKDFADELNATIDQYFPTYDKPYGQVAVLALHWEHDDIGVQPLEAELLDVLRHRYNFWVESYEIPNTANAGVQLVQKLANFTAKWDAEDALLIYIYSGHAGQADAAGTRYVLG